MGKKAGHNDWQGQRPGPNAPAQYCAAVLALKRKGVIV